MSSEANFIIQSGGGFLIELEKTDIPLLHTDPAKASRFTWDTATGIATRMRDLGIEAKVGHNATLLQRRDL